jgi:ribulose-phosphate 3-epimerase
MPALYPSLIAADLLNLQKVIMDLEPVCDGYHLDIMDNHFVPNLTMGAAFVNAIAKVAAKPLWVHLMVEKPDDFFMSLTVPAGTIISFHFESKVNHRDFIKRIREKNCRPSIAIAPKTSVENLFPFLDLIDQALIMSVQPGFSGQPFLPSAKTALDEIVAYRDTSKLPFKIGMDGGINYENIGELVEMGVDDFALANGVFGFADPKRALQMLKEKLILDNEK